MVTKGISKAEALSLVGAMLLLVCRNASADLTFGVPTNVGLPVNTASYDRGSSISGDRLELYFHSLRLGGVGVSDLWVAKRTGKDDPWTAPVKLAAIVNIHDLRVLTQYLTKDVYDPTLVAHWTLDETEGRIAHDSAGENDGAVMGNAVWQSDVAMIDGALAVDGVDDFVGVNLILNPKDSPFSMLAWIKGGAPGQVIISQADARVGRLNHSGRSWLAIDPILGILTTDFAGSDFVPPETAVVITDGQWHRVGLVWDESANTSSLYVDGVEVAAHARPTRPTARDGLQIGVGRSGEPGTFFSGLIDDVRIDNRAVRPWGFAQDGPILLCVLVDEDTKSLFGVHEHETDKWLQNDLAGSCRGHSNLRGHSERGFHLRDTHKSRADRQQWGW